MTKKRKIICTIGPGSNKTIILEKLADRGVDFFRINLSHTDEDKIESRIKDLLGYGIPIILDTEGAQVRSGNIEEISFNEGGIVKMHFSETKCNSDNLFLRPEGVVKRLQEGDLISIDFNSLLLRVFDTSTKDDGYVLCKVVISGLIGGKKAVQIDSPTFILPPFSKKDYTAIQLAKKYGINHFTLSFMESSEEVLAFKKFHPLAKLYSKIESKKGLENFLEILNVSDGILIDRGDLSSQVPLEKIPFIQKLILKKAEELGKEAFVATNTLEQMSNSLKPNKAEVNDIINIFLDGASGVALTKETAVGKYPVETVNMLVNLIDQVEFIEKNSNENLIQKILGTNYLTSENAPEMLIKPHGKVLVNCINSNYPEPKKAIEISEENLMDMEQIAIGAFSPISGFMKSNDFNSIVNDMKLSNGIVWPLPIFLSIDFEARKNLFENEDVGLKFNGEIFGILHLEEIYQPDKENASEKIYGTKDTSHPGVKKFMESGEYFLGGKITLLKRRNSIHKMHELTPKQTRKIFSERGWSKVAGFHTRNIIHKSHEFIQMEGMKKGLCDGLLVHPVIGSKKTGDFESEIIIESYEKMIEDFYPKSEVVLGAFATYSRYAGPREALFTALVRKNFGCSHFIIGRDHTGVGTFYSKKASHEIFDKFDESEIGIKPIKFGEVFYSDLENRHIHEEEFINHPKEHRLSLSGTQARKIFSDLKNPPEWFMRPEISEIVIEKIKNGEKVFV
ncbi:MAG: sulfate adenylyltransferase [Nanoarchaeota archaeon]